MFRKRNQGRAIFHHPVAQYTRPGITSQEKHATLLCLGTHDDFVFQAVKAQWTFGGQGYTHIAITTVRKPFVEPRCPSRIRQRAVRHHRRCRSGAVRYPFTSSHSPHRKEKHRTPESLPKSHFCICYFWKGTARREPRKMYRANISSLEALQSPASLLPH